MESIDFSVIVCTRNRPEALFVTLGSIAKQTQTPYEVIVVDGSGDDSSERQCRNASFKWGLIIKYIRAERSLTEQRNAGIRQNRGEVVVFLDDDVILDKHYFQKMAAYFSRCQSRGEGTRCTTHPKGKSKTMAMKTLQNFPKLKNRGKKAVAVWDL